MGRSIVIVICHVDAVLVFEIGFDFGQACLISAATRTRSSQSVMEMSLSVVNAKRCVTEAAEAVTASLASARLSLVSWGM